MSASHGGGAARLGGSPRRAVLTALRALAIAAVLAGGCASPAREGLPPGVTIATSAQPGGAERYCAWYGDPRGGVLYFGESAFWASERAHGDPLADRVVPGPRRIGRFDLSRRRMLDRKRVV